MNLDDLIPRALLDDALEQGHVRKQTHPDLPLAILNYTERAAYDSIWNEATLTCRGLIYDERDRMVLAHPFPKFFNYGQPGAPELDLDAPAVVTEKMDGSLGILYPLGEPLGGYAVATRGSFTSDQALWATEWLRQNVPSSIFDPRLSYLFEIIVGWNRIVVDYDFEGLVLLAIRDTETGRDLDLSVASGLLPPWPTRDDAGEHGSPSEGVEALPRLQEGDEETRHGDAPRTPESVWEGLAEAESREAQRGAPGAGAGGADDARRDQSGDAVRGLREDVPAGLHGLRPRQGDEELQRRVGDREETRPAAAGDREVRARMRELSSDSDRDETHKRILRACGVTEEELAALDGGYAAARDEAIRQEAAYVEWARGIADEFSKIIAVALFVPVVERHPYRSLAEALAAEPRPGKEGLVVYLPAGDVRVKIKQADYVALHRIVTGLNKRTVWEHLGAGKPIEDLIAPLPDEFRPWVEDVVAELSATVAAQAGEIERLYSEIVNELTDGDGRLWVCEECGGGLVWVTEGCEGGPCPGWACSTFGCGSQWRVVEPARKQFAMLATKSPWAWALFQRLDGKDYGPKLWYLNRPDPETPAGRVYTEDAA